MNFLNKKRGFTLIEVVVVTGIIVVFAAVVTISISGTSRTQLMKSTQEDILSIFSEAKARTIASEDSASYGVHLESDRIVLFKGTEFSEPSSDNKELELSSILQITDINLTGGVNSVVFNRLTGESSAAGTFVLHLDADTSLNRTFTITQTGVLSVE